MYKPLAERIRPKTLEEMVGQPHLIGERGLLRRVIESGHIPNMIFFGPSGTGKTTLANIIAASTGRRLHKLNATTASIGDIRDIIAELDTFLAPGGVLLYLDEIQYFNKKQQQSLLEFIENGSITLIASTTENPYFYVYNAILSRSTVFEFLPIQAGEIEPAVERAFILALEDAGVEAEVPKEVVFFLSNACDGDVRKALNAVELLVYSAAAKGGEITLEDAALIARKSGARYDREGDSHYDILSAFHKSLRGSDPDAALHYLARMLVAGDIISPARRMLAMASEDIGLAYPMATAVVKACVDSAFQLGLPEALLPMAQAAILLATSPKSNSVGSIGRAMADVQAGKSGDIPAHLKDAHYAGSKKLGHGTTYLYPHSFPDHWTEQQYLPDTLMQTTYYEYGENKLEQATKKYWEEVRRRQKEGQKKD